MLTVIEFVWTLIISYAGLYVGVWLGVNSPEELTPGKKYLVIAKHILQILLLLALIYILRSEYVTLAVVLLLYAVFGIAHKRWSFKLHEFYFIAPLCMLMVSKNEQSVFLLASIVFLYGLPAGSLLVQPHAKHKSLLVHRRQLLYKAFNMTLDFFSVLALATLIFLIGTMR